MTITKGISIINDGVGEAGALVSGGLVGITVNAGPNDRVSLRGLTVKGIGFGGGNGIRLSGGKSLTIENCAVRNLTGDAVQVLSDMPANSTTSFTMSNTLVSDTDANGIYFRPTGSGNLVATLSRVEVYNNGAHGIGVDGGASAVNARMRVIVADSVISNNGLSGVAASTLPGTGQAHASVYRSVIVHNQNGVFGESFFASVSIGGSIVENNVTSMGGLVFSFGDNYWTNFTEPTFQNTFAKK